MIDPTSIPQYKPEEIEPKWQARWEADGLYHADPDPKRTKFYALTMLPYPSGDLHIGHWYAMTPSDARARFKRMQGYNVFFPIGFDAFGLPAENAAIKKQIHPKQWTYANIERMRTQLRSMGNMFDWRSEVVTSDPEYYRWTQWFFVQFFKHNLAYQMEAPVDFCPNCNTTLAREQVQGEDRHCERCGTPVIKKNLKQWLFRITNYAEELLDFSDIDWPDTIKTLQTNWIGRSKGAYITFKTESGEPIEVFTTRPDTLWGVTFLVLAPEHPLVNQITTSEQAEAVAAYQEQAMRQSEIQREAANREKTGVFTGAYAIHPATGERIPIWIADYVLMTYGTGAIMAVPAHDSRDYAFAKHFNLPIIPLIEGCDVSEESFDAKEGIMINSGFLNGMTVKQAITAAIDEVERRGLGYRKINYRLRDAIFSRQRYWGEPFPVYYKDGMPYTLDESELPLELPEVDKFLPTETGEPPLARAKNWRTKEGYPLELNTMPGFAGSSAYYLRYMDPHNNEALVSEKADHYWRNVDVYVVAPNMPPDTSFTAASGINSCSTWEYPAKKNPLGSW